MVHMQQQEYRQTDKQVWKENDGRLEDRQKGRQRLCTMCRNIVKIDRQTGLQTDWFSGDWLTDRQTDNN